MSRVRPLPRGETKHLFVKWAGFRYRYCRRGRCIRTSFIPQPDPDFYYDVLQ